MQLHWFGRLAPLFAGAFLTFPFFASLLVTSPAFAQTAADPEKPVTPPDSYRVVMENDRMRMLEVHIKPHSKVEVDTPPNRERFLYMLSDGALILAPPGKTPYEFALHAGETAVFPPVSQTVENDTDVPVRALMVEIKEGGRAVAVASGKRGKLAKRGARGKVVVVRSSGKTKVTKVVASRSKPAKTKQVAKSAKPKAVAKGPKPPLNLSKAATKPARKVTGKSRGSDG
jgi:hypothetical protein